MNAAVFQRSAAGLAEKIGLHKPQLSTSATADRKDDQRPVIGNIMAISCEASAYPNCLALTHPSSEATSLEGGPSYGSTRAY
jgi:hypothetical protein